MLARLLVAASSNDEDEDGYLHGGDGGERDAALRGLQLLPLGHGASKEQVEAKGRRANQTEKNNY